MPQSPARLCSQGHRFTGSRCPQCDRRYDQHRGSAASRGYDAGWEAFRLWFVAQLAQHGLEPSCGAVLPGGPQTQDSRCRALGRKMFGRLHLDHEPPLQPHERTDPRAVQDPTRCQLLCQSCHGYKTWREHQFHTAKTLA